MYVHVRKSGNNRYVYIMEAYRNSEGKVAHRTIEKLGRYDLLYKKDPNFLQKLKDNLKLRSQFPRYQQIEEENRWLEAQKLNVSYTEGNQLAYCGMPVYSYANRVLRLIFRKILNLEYVLSHMQAQSEKQYNFNVATLIYHRILAKFFSGSDCVCGTYYNFIGDSFDLKEEHSYLPQIRALISAQQERILTYLLRKASKNANLPQVAVALSELNEATLQNFITSLGKLPQDEKERKLLSDIQPFVEKLTPKRAPAKRSGQTWLNEFEALVTKAMLEIIRKALKDKGHDFPLVDIQKALTHALMTVYIPPQSADGTLYIKLANSQTELNSQILLAFGFEPPLNCSRKNELLRSLKMKYCATRDIIGADTFDRFVIPYKS